MRKGIVALLFAIALDAVVSKDLPAVPFTSCSAPWQFAGPEAYVDQSNFEIANSTNAGAAQVITGVNGVWYTGTVNGGVWRSKNIHDDVPHWEPLFDGQPVTCSAMHAVTIAPFDADMVVAGCGGATSSEMGFDWNVLNSGDWGGVMVSLDAGDSWTMTNFPDNYFVTAIVVQYPQRLIVSARSNFFDRNDGGVWVSEDLGASWNRTFDRPVFDLVEDPKSHQVYAALALAHDTVHTSADGGYRWKAVSSGLKWGKFLPFYPRLAISTAGKTPVLFLAALMVDPKNQSSTWSHVYASNGNSSPVWRLVPGQPVSLDQDAMPKDRVAILADPSDPDLIYVAGNAYGPGPCFDNVCSLVFRINWVDGIWTYMSGSKDTTNNGNPHADNRDLAWDFETDSLLLSHDGGVTLRTIPRRPGGIWQGVDGDISSLEFYNADWDSRLKRWIGGSQDNDFLVLPPRSTGNLRALGYGGCDGTRTAVDNTNCPSRLFSSCQFLMGLTMFAGWEPMTQISIDLSKFFPDLQDLPYFVHPFTLNTQDPDRLLFYVNGTFEHSSAIYQITVPTSKDDKINPTVVENVEGGIYDFVAGGFTDGVPDSEVLVGMNNTHLVFRTSKQPLTYRRLPTEYAQPVVLVSFFDNFTQSVLGPVSHGKTVSVAVSPADSSTVLVCGWPVQMNDGAESIHLTRDGGASWTDVTGNLLSATGTIARIRPSGPVIIEYTALGFDAIVMGTVSGVFVSFTDHLGIWSRLGQTKEFPHVMTMSVKYEHYSDTIIAATMGRGVFIIEGAKAAILKARQQQLSSTCDVKGPFNPPSSAKYFPTQRSC